MRIKQTTGKTSNNNKHIAARKVLPGCREFFTQFSKTKSITNKILNYATKLRQIHFENSEILDQIDKITFVFADKKKIIMSTDFISLYTADGTRVVNNMLLRLVATDNVQNSDVNIPIVAAAFHQALWQSVKCLHMNDADGWINDDNIDQIYELMDNLRTDWC